MGTTSARRPAARVVDLSEDRDAFSTANCSVARALEVVGTRSAMLLLREAFYGTRRFDQFARRVGVTEAVAATRLRAMVDDGLLTRSPYREPGQRTRHEYRLTRAGRELYPALVALLHWGDVWAADEIGPPVVLTHRTCGEPVHAEVRCAAGHPVTPRDVAVIAGPGLRLAQTTEDACADV